MVPVGGGGVRDGEKGGQADIPLDRILDLPLVPRHGARILRGRRSGRAHERNLRFGEGGQGGAPRHRQRLHDRLPHALGGKLRVAPQCGHDPGGRAVFRGDLHTEGEPLRKGRDGRARSENTRALGREKGGGREFRPPDNRGGAPRGRHSGRGRTRRPGRKDPRARLRLFSLHFRPRRRRVRTGSQVSHSAQPHVPHETPREDRKDGVPRHGGKNPRGHGKGRSVRPRGLRFSQVFHRFGLARSPLREDALRPGASVHRLHRGLAAF